MRQLVYNEDEFFEFLTIPKRDITTDILISKEVNLPEILLEFVENDEIKYFSYLKNRVVDRPINKDDYDIIQNENLQMILLTELREKYEVCSDVLKRNSLYYNVTDGILSDKIDVINHLWAILDTRRTKRKL